MSELTMTFAALITRPTRILILMALSLAVSLWLTPNAFAQTKSATSSTTTTTTTTTKTASETKGEPKKTTVNFEDQLIEGQTQKPELFYLLQQRSNNFKRLIKLRENFLPEMRDTAEDFSSSGSSANNARRGTGH